jgi:hypothetical protein
MYLLTTPFGSTYQYVHTLVSDELYNNSFDAISPDTRWMVSGEWGTMTHLQITNISQASGHYAAVTPPSMKIV